MGATQVLADSSMRLRSSDTPSCTSMLLLQWLSARASGELMSSSVPRHCFSQSAGLSRATNIWKRSAGQVEKLSSGSAFIFCFGDDTLRVFRLSAPEALQRNNITECELQSPFIQHVKRTHPHIPCFASIGGESWHIKHSPALQASSSRLLTC